MNVQLDRDGYVIVPGVLDAAEVSATVAACAAALEANAEGDSVLTNRGGAAYGARNLLRLCPGAVELLRKPPLAAILTEELGPRAGVVRGLFT